MENQHAYRILAQQLLACAADTADSLLARRMIHQAADWHELALLIEGFEATAERPSDSARDGSEGIAGTPGAPDPDAPRDRRLTPGI